MPRAAMLKLAAGLAGAAVAIAVLLSSLRQADARTAGGDAARGGAPQVAARAPARHMEAAAPDLPASVEAVLQRVRGGRARRVELAQDVAAFAPDAAPVVAVLSGGELRLLRPPPLPQRPDADVWPSAGLVLPHAFEELDARERAAAALALGRLGGGRTFAAGAVVVHEPLRRGPVLEALLRWMR